MASLQAYSQLSVIEDLYREFTKGSSMNQIEIQVLQIPTSSSRTFYSTREFYKIHYLGQKFWIERTCSSREARHANNVPEPAILETEEIKIASESAGKVYTLEGKKLINKKEVLNNKVFLEIKQDLSSLLEEFM